MSLTSVVSPSSDYPLPSDVHPLYYSAPNTPISRKKKPFDEEKRCSSEPPKATLSKISEIRASLLAKEKKEMPLSKEEYIKRFIESFETYCESMDDCFPESKLTKEEHEKHYKAYCTSVYARYIMKVTTHNDPATVIDPTLHIE